MRPQESWAQKFQDWGLARMGVAHLKNIFLHYICVCAWCVCGWTRGDQFCANTWVPGNPAQLIGLGGWAFTHWVLCWLMGIVCKTSCQHRSLMVPHPPLRDTAYSLSCQKSNHMGPKHPSKPPTISWNMVEYLSWVWTLLAGGLFAGRRKWGITWTLLD